MRVRPLEQRGRMRIGHTLMFALLSVALVTVVACGHDRNTRYRVARFDSVEITRDVAYGPDPEQLLDVYEPAGDEVAQRPALVWIHGGGFAAGDKSEGPFISFPTTFAKLGYVSVSIDYTLAASEQCIGSALESSVCTGAITAATEDARAAVRWLRSNASRYRVDYTRIAVAGESAGGITATSLAVSPIGRDEVQAFVSISGGLGSTVNIDRGDPPGYLASNTEDPFVPYEWSASVSSALEALAIPTQLRTFEGPGHVPVDEYGEIMVDDARDFLYKQLDLAEAQR